MQELVDSYDESELKDNNREKEQDKTEETKREYTRINLAPPESLVENTTAEEKEKLMYSYMKWAQELTEIIKIKH